MSKLDDASRPGPCAAVLRVERAVCATGTAWGLLKGQPFWVLILYWAFRHVVYAGAAIALIIYIPASIIAIGSFIVFIHIYKVARFMGDEKHRNVSPAAPMSPADALSTDAKGEP